MCVDSMLPINPKSTSHLRTLSSLGDGQIVLFVGKSTRSGFARTKIALFVESRGHRRKDQVMIAKESVNRKYTLAMFPIKLPENQSML